MTTLQPGPADADLSFADIPAAEPDAELDPYWADMRAGHALPAAYLPPAMAGRRGPAMRLVAVVLVAIFLAATAAGVCLTYGPQAPFH
jgi:hypothetical protein